MKRIHSLFLCFAILFVFTISISAGTVRKEFKEVYHFESGGFIQVENVNGRISVEAWDEERVDVFAEIEVKARTHVDAEAFMEEVEILVDLKRDQLYIETDFPRLRGGSVWDAIFSGGKKPQVSIEFWIRVPERSDLSLRSVNGRVEIRDVEGTAELATTNGSIFGDNMRGSVDARTTNGNIDVELRTLDDNEDMIFKTTNGGIELILPRNIRADISASTVNGRVSTDFPMEVRGNYNRKRVRGSVNGGGGLIDLHTVNGSIRIRER